MGVDVYIEPIWDLGKECNMKNKCRTPFLNRQRNQTTEVFFESISSSTLRLRSLLNQKPSRDDWAFVGVIFPWLFIEVIYKLLY